jgi:hypothetical protein
VLNRSLLRECYSFFRLQLQVIKIFFNTPLGSTQPSWGSGELVKIDKRTRPATGAPPADFQHGFTSVEQRAAPCSSNKGSK